MNKSFQFRTPKNLIIGDGTISQLEALAITLPTPIAVITGARKDRHNLLWASLSKFEQDLIPLINKGEPTIDELIKLTKFTRKKGCKSVIAMGGGSVIDMGKAISALLVNTQHPNNYLEIIGKSLPLDYPAVPMIAIPTTAGTGAEATRNSVISIPNKKVKVSLRHSSMIPETVIIDPILTLSTPRNITTASGLDALTQLIEAFCSNRAHPLTDALCRSGLNNFSLALENTLDDGNNLKARSHLAHAALMSGIALTHVGLGSVHGFAGPLGGRLKKSHGEICATLLPIAIETNIRALQKRDTSQNIINKYNEAASLVLNNPKAKSDDLCIWIRNILSQMCVPKLHDLGFRESDMITTIKQAQKSSSMKSNPVELTETELKNLLEQEPNR